MTHLTRSNGMMIRLDMIAYELDELFCALQLRTWMCICLIEGRKRFGLVQTSDQLYSRDELFSIFLLRQIVGQDRGMLCRARWVQPQMTTAVRRFQLDNNRIGLPR